jgi:hypothetical protein
VQSIHEINLLFNEEVENWTHVERQLTTATTVVEETNMLVALVGYTRGSQSFQLA